MSERIRWEPNGDGNVLFGYVGTLGGIAFRIWAPDDTHDDWLLSDRLTALNGGGRFIRADDPATLKTDAEFILSGFVSSLGAVFPAEAAADLRARADEMEGYCDGEAEGRHDRSMFATGLRRAADLIEHGDVPAANPEPSPAAGTETTDA
jgi:hypothetical protein